MRNLKANKSNARGKAASQSREQRANRDELLDKFVRHMRRAANEERMDGHVPSIELLHLQNGAHEAMVVEEEDHLYTRATLPLPGKTVGIWTELAVDDVVNFFSLEAGPYVGRLSCAILSPRQALAYLLCVQKRNAGRDVKPFDVQRLPRANMRPRHLFHRHDLAGVDLEAAAQQAATDMGLDVAVEPGPTMESTPQPAPAPDAAEPARDAVSDTPASTAGDPEDGMRWAIPSMLAEKDPKAYDLCAGAQHMHMRYAGKCGKRLVVVNGEAWVTDKSGRCTDDGRMVQVPEWATRRPPYVTNAERLQTTLTSIMPHIMAQLGPQSDRPVHNVLKAAYRRNYPNYADLDGDISVLLTTRTVAQQIRVMTDPDAMVERRYNHAKWHLAKLGHTEEWVEWQVRYQHRWNLLQHRVKNVLTLGMYSWFNECPTERLAKVQVTERAATAVRRVAIAPCSMAYLAAQVKHRVELPPQVRETAVPSSDQGDKFTDKSFDVYGTTIAGVPAVMPANTLANLRSGIHKRFGHPVNLDENAVADFMGFAQREIDKLPRVDIEVADEQAWLRNNYPGQKGAELSELYAEPLEASDLATGGFVKTECYLNKDPSGEHAFKPRFIATRQKRFVAKFAHTFAQIGDSLKAAFSPLNDVVYATCMTPDQLGDVYERIRDRGLRWMVSDHSNMDGHEETFCQDVERYYMETRVSDFPDKAWLMSHWNDPTRLKAYGRGDETGETLQYSISGKRRSGDLWTASFNFLINWLLIKWATQAEEMAAMILGDDNLGGLRTQLTDDQVTARFAKLGFATVFYTTEDEGMLEFCSGHFAPVNGHMRYVNKPMRLLAKLGINKNGHPEKKWKRLLYGTARGMLCTAGHAPVAGALLRAITTTASALGIKPYVDNSDRNPYRPQGGATMRPGNDTYAFYADLWGTSVLELQAIDTWIETHVSIEDFPFQVVDERIQEFARMEGMRVVDRVSGLEVSDEVVREEQFKLRAPNLLSAMNRAWVFGSDEDRMAGTTSHAFLHVLFTTVAFVNFSLGCMLHEAYNHYARAYFQPPCTKNKGMNNITDRRSKATRDVDQARQSDATGAKVVAKKHHAKKTHNNHVSSRAVRSIEEQNDNALLYFLSVYSPWDYTGVRKPDMTLFPTATLSDEWQATTALYQCSGVTTDYIGCMLLAPHPRSSVYTVTAPVSASSFAVSYGLDSPNYTDINTRFRALRAVSMGARIIDYGKIADRGITCYAGLLPAVWIKGGVMSMAMMQATPEMRLVDISDDGVLNLAWLPIDGGPWYDDTDNKFEPFASSWFDPACDRNDFADSDNVLAIVMYTGVAGTSDAIAVSITTNYEGIPYAVYQRTTARETCVGGQESLASVYAAIHNKEAQYTPAVKSVLESGVHALQGGIKQTVKAISKAAGPIVGEAAKKGVQTLASAAGEAIGGLFSERHKVFRLMVLAGLHVSYYDPMVDALMGVETTEQLRQVAELVRIGRRFTHRGVIHSHGYVTAVRDRPLKSIHAQFHGRCEPATEDAVVVE